MNLSHERAYILSKILNYDKERAKKLLSLKPDVARLEINTLGYDFTIMEIKEYGDALRANIRGHLSSSTLGSTTGGVMDDNPHDYLFDTLLLKGLHIEKVKW